MNRTISLKELRPKLPQVVDAIDSHLDRYFITRRGNPCAVLMSPDDYEGLLETLDILQDKAGIGRLKKAMGEVKKGHTRSLQEIDRKIGRA